MNIIQIILKKINNLKDWFIKRSLLVKIILIAVIIAFGWLILNKFNSSKSQQPQYQTAQVTKDTLIVSISASGQVSSVNSASVMTQASGIVKNLYVKDGDQVKAGDKIAEIDLDMTGRQKSAQALASYQSGKNSLESAKANLYSLQSDMLTKWKSYMDIAQSSLYQNSDNSPKNDTRQLPQFMSTNDDWLATEAKYKNQQAVINQAQTSLNSVWLSYQQASPIIYAPITGTVTGLSLQVGSVISTQMESSSNTASGQKIASIQTKANPTVTINLSEIDVSKVKIGNKATITLDALPGKSYTGQVVSIDKVGAVSSGVTTYPIVIKLDTENENVYANMSAQAGIITDTKDNVLLVPVSAVQTQDGQSLVRVMKNGRVEQIPVEVGLISDIQVEIVSGISEGDTIVTSIISSVGSQTQINQSQSLFGGAGFGSFGGGALRPGGSGGGARGGGMQQH